MSGITKYRKINKLNRAQSIIDYSILIAIIAISILAMYRYIFKAVNARIAHIKADLNDPVNGIR